MLKSFINNALATQALIHLRSVTCGFLYLMHIAEDLRNIYGFFGSKLRAKLSTQKVNELYVTFGSFRYLAPVITFLAHFQRPTIPAPSPPQHMGC